MPQQLKKIVRIPLRDQILDSIKRAIITGKFRASEKISEEELAEQLGVSRTPIREAIRVLEQQGLVEVIPKDGTYVTSFDSDQIKDGLHVRVALEQLALKQSIERLSDSEWRKHCDHLQDLVDQMLKAAEDFDAEKDAELDIDWHTAIIDASRNQNLSRTWRLTGLSHFIWSIEYRLYPLNQNDLLSHHERHQKLLNVFIEKNPEKCAKELQHHILRKIQDIDF
jgi:DNA-binding GntR family transcriptional regulator